MKVNDPGKYSIEYSRIPGSKLSSSFTLIKGDSFVVLDSPQNGLVFLHPQHYAARKTERAIGKNKVD